MSAATIRSRIVLLLFISALIGAGAVQAQPQISVAPESLTETLSPGSSGTQSLTISNTGDSPLTVTADRGPATSAAGGPDDFGYTWTDSDQAGGPLFRWRDIRATGTHHPLQGTGDVWVDLPFDFPFYGETYGQVKVYANGLISFFPTYQGSTSNNRPIPWWDHPSLFIAGFWTNLNPELGGGVYTGIDELGRFVVQYHDVARAGGAEGRYTFQIILGEDGTIVTQYGPMNGPTDIATVGIENANSTTGLEVAYNAPYVYEGLAVRISVGDPWLSVGGDEMTLAPGGSVDLPVAFSSHDLPAGTVVSALRLSSDDPATPVLDVPVSLSVLSEPGVEISRTEIDFGEVQVGAAATDSVTVVNTGTVDLTLSSITTDGPPFTASMPGSSTLQPGQARVVYVEFEPDAATSYTGTLNIGTDHPDEPVLSVSLGGEGLAAPGITVSPSSIDVDLDVGESTTEIVTVGNEGAADLNLVAGFRFEGGASVDSLYYDYGWDQAGTAGFPPGQPAAAANRFTADGPFRLNAIGAMLRVQHDPSVTFKVYGAGNPGEPTSGPLLWEGDVELPHSSSVIMHQIALGTTLEFDDGEDFYIVIERASETASPFGNHFLDSGRSYYRYHGGGWQLATHTLTFVIRALTSLDGALSVEPATATVPAGGSQDLAVTMDATALPGGQHAATLVLGTNDPLNPEVLVPITIDVTGMPGVVLMDSSLEFGEVYLGETRTLTTRVRNLGTGPVTVSEVTSSSPLFTFEPVEPFTLPAGASDTLFVTFAPDVAGTHDGTITLTTTDPDNPTLELAVSGEGVDFPAITTDPESMTIELVAGETATTSFTIANAGDGPLSYALEGLTGHPQAADPDGFGYTWTDSNHPGGPVFNWVDISGTGTALELGSNDYEDVELPFIFPFYGDEKMIVRIASNGYLTFGNQRGDVWQARPIPHSWPPNDFIAPYWTNLDPSAGGSVYHGTDAEGRFVVTYDSVTTHSTDSWRTTFQVILDEGGNITFQYLQRSAPFSGTVGIENPDATDGLQITHNEFPSYVQDGLAVRIAAPTPWLTAADPAEGIVAPGESVEVTLTVDTGDLEQGIYPASLRIASNDPQRPMAVVPVNLEVAGALRIHLDAGWNLVSFNVEPEDMAVEAVLEAIMDRVEALATYENDELRSFVPGAPDNTITHLMPTYGYWVKVSEASLLEIEGEPVDVQHALELVGGINAVSYLPWRMSGVEHALESVVEVTKSATAFQGTGVTYAPEVPVEFHVLDRMRPRSGYVLRTMAPGTLVYPMSPGPGNPGGDERPTLEGRIAAEQQAGVVATLAWMDVWGDEVVISQGNLLPAGSLVTAHTPAGLVVGAFETVVEGRIGLLPIYGNDPFTDEIDGALPGDIITLQVDGVVLAEVEWTMPGDVRELSDLPVSSEPGGNDLPLEIALDQNYPNPFRLSTTLRFSLPEAEHVRLTVYDALGRVIVVLADGEHQPGTHDVVWDANDVAAGIYIVRLEAGGVQRSQRMTVLR